MIVENSQRRYHDEYADYKYWIDALIPHTIQRISFESFSNYNESLLEALISKSPDLIHLEFASETRSSRFYQQIVGSEAMRNVRLLQYSGSIMDPDILQWFSQMPQLSTLELTLDQEDSEDPNIPEVAYESYAFQAMTTLKVYTCDHSEVENQWDLLRQMWRTPMVKRLTCVEIKVSEPILPGMREFDQFMSVLASQSPNVSNLRLEASGTLANFPEIPVEALSDIRQLPLRTLTIQSPIHSKADQSLFKSLGEINAQLEILDLGSTTVEISDLISAHRYLPSLRYLNIGVWKTKTSKQKLKRSWFSDNNVPFVFPIHPPCSSSLLLRFRERKLAPNTHAYNFDYLDVHLIAVLLATRWSSVNLYGELPSDRMDILRTRIDVWRGKAERNWEEVAKRVLTLSKRS